MVDQEETAGSNMGEKRSWTSDELRTSSYHWSLAGDAALLGKLQNMAQMLVSRTHQIQQEVDSLNQSTAATHSKLGNVVNDFLMLSNTQFVENRVYDEEISDPSVGCPSESKIVMEKTKEEQKREIVGKVSVALRLGMSVIETAYEQLHVQDTDSEDEEAEPYAHEPILHPKDPYQNRPLPCIIGTAAFSADDYVGIGLPFLGEDDRLEVDANSLSSFEESGNVLPKDYSSNEEEDEAAEEATRESKVIIPNQNNYDQMSSKSGEIDLFDSGTNAQSEEEEVYNNDVVTKPNEKNFRKELANKLKLPRARSDSESSGEGRDITARSSRSRQSSSASRDLVSSYRESTQNQNRGLERRVIENETEDDDDDDDGLFAKKGLFSKKGRLFDNLGEEDEDMFFRSSSQKKVTDNNIMAKKAAVKNETLSKLSVSKSDSLFDDDDDGDLFSNPTPSKDVSKREKRDSIFNVDDEDDLFVGSSKKDTGHNVSNPVKKILPGAVSMFGSGVNPLNLKHPKLVKDDDRHDGEKEDGSPGSRTSFKSTQSASLKDTRKGSPSNSASSSSTALFADEPDVDDLFSISESASIKRKPIGGISLFDDEDADDSDDIFAPKSKQKLDRDLEPSKKIQSQSKKESLFDSKDDDDDDIFANIGRKKEILQVKPVSSLFEDVGNEKFEKPTSRLKVSMFDDDDGGGTADLFGSTPSTSISKSKTKSTGKSLFDDDSLLFGSSIDDNPEIDLFGRSTVSSIMKDEAKEEEASKAMSSSSSASAVTGHKSNLRTADHDSDDDLFRKKPTIDARNASTASQPLPKIPSKLVETHENMRPIATKDLITAKGLIAVPSESIETSAESPRKKPVGGVALFGGSLPPLLKPQQRSVSPSRHETISGRENALTPERRSPSPFGGPLTVPSKESAIGFDQPVEANPLHNANKDRIKIPVKRRPPTRRGRQEALRKSAIDVIGGDIIEDFLQDNSTTASAPTSPASPDPDKVAEFTAALKRSQGEAVDADCSSSHLPVPPATTTMVTSPSTEEEDLFPIGTGMIPAPSVPLSSSDKTASRLKKSLFNEGNGEGGNDDTDDLFSTKPKAVPLSKPSPSLRHKIGEKKSTTVAKNSSLFGDLDRDSTTDLFSSDSLTSKVKSNGSNDLSDSESKTQRSSNMTRGKSLFDDDDDDGDIFKMSSSRKSTLSSKTTSSSSKSLSSSSAAAAVRSIKSKTDSSFDDPLMVNKKD